MSARYLVAVDEGDACSVAEVAADLVRTRGHSAELHIVHVVKPTVAEVPIGLVSTEALLESGTSVVAAAEDVARDHFPGKIVRHVRMGYPASEIVALASELEADMVVVGTKDKGPLKRAFIGSVASDVVRKARCPVLVTRAKAHASTYPSPSAESHG